MQTNFHAKKIEEICLVDFVVLNDEYETESDTETDTEIGHVRFCKKFED